MERVRERLAVVVPVTLMLIILLLGILAMAGGFFSAAANCVPVVPAP